MSTSGQTELYEQACSRLEIVEKRTYLIELDENGGISKYRVTSPGEITVSTSEFVEARRLREAKHAEYEMRADENALKREMLEQEIREMKLF